MINFKKRALLAVVVAAAAVTPSSAAACVDDLTITWQILNKGTLYTMDCAWLGNCESTPGCSYDKEEFCNAFVGGSFYIFDICPVTCGTCPTTDVPSETPTATPTDVPTDSPTAVPSFTPTTGTDNGDMCSKDVYKSATINPDPHYTTWDNHEFDFQGGCDQIAVDNPKLQIQIRTRPRDHPNNQSFFSTVTQIAILFKESGDIFHMNHADHPAVTRNDLILPTSNNGVTYKKTDDSLHDFYWITFDNLTNSHIKITSRKNPNDRRYYDRGFTLQIINGHASIFCGSVGMLGSFDEGMARFPKNNVVFESWPNVSIQNTASRSIDLAKAWQVGANGETNLLTSPSTICDASNKCGPGYVFQCDNSYRARERNLVRSSRDLQETSSDPPCPTTDCSFIQQDVVRAACEEDLRITNGDTSWTCQATYLDPVVSDADPCTDFQNHPDCLSNAACLDSSLRLKIPKDGGFISRSCAWVGRKDTFFRCSMTGVSEACPFTCGTCNVCADPPSSMKFKFLYNGKMVKRSCDFIKRIPSKEYGRCKQSRNICRATCEVCS